MLRTGMRSAALGLVVGVPVIAMEQGACIVLPTKANLPAPIDPVTERTKQQSLTAFS